MLGLVEPIEFKAHEARACPRSVIRGNDTKMSYKLAPGRAPATWRPAPSQLGRPASSVQMELMNLASVCVAQQQA